MFGPGSSGYRHLFGVAYRMVGSSHDAEDAVQDALVKWHSLSAQEQELVRQPLAWLTRPRRDAVVAAFAQACVDGDVERLAAVLDPDVVSRADGGAHIRAARKVVTGIAAVTSYLLGVLATQTERMAPLRPSIEPVNGRSGIVIRSDGGVVGVIDLEIVDGTVREIALVVNPEKLDSLV